MKNNERKESQCRWIQNDRGESPIDVKKRFMIHNNSYICLINQESQRGKAVMKGSALINNIDHQKKIRNLFIKYILFN